MKNEMGMQVIKAKTRGNILTKFVLLKSYNLFRLIYSTFTPKNKKKASTHKQMRTTICITLKTTNGKPNTREAKAFKKAVNVVTL